MCQYGQYTAVLYNSCDCERVTNKKRFVRWSKIIEDVLAHGHSIYFLFSQQIKYLGLGMVSDLVLVTNRLLIQMDMLHFQDLCVLEWILGNLFSCDFSFPFSCELFSEMPLDLFPLITRSVYYSSSLNQTCARVFNQRHFMQSLAGKGIIFTKSSYNFHLVLQ